MRDCEKNKQDLHYSLYSDRVVVYEKDNDGNIIYDNGVPRIESELAGYELPVTFEANISTSGGEAKSIEYGYEIGSFEAIISTTDKSLPIDKKSLIWHTTEPRIVNGEVDPDSADYRVLAVKPSINEVKYLLKMLTK